MTDWSEEEVRQNLRELWSLATAVPDSCFSVVVAAYENVRSDGLCHGLARILGHESLETTGVYLRLTVDDLAQWMEQMSINAYG